MGSSLLPQSQPPPASSSAGAGSASPGPTINTSPQWMVVAPYGGGYDKACNITGDPKTIAAAVTSGGHPISVSLHRELFSALSRICLRYLPGSADGPWASSTVIAAHNGSLLVLIMSRESYMPPDAYDYFVYGNVVAAAAAARSPPSLHLLPVPARGLQRLLDVSATGILCRGEAEFVVAELTIVGSKEDVAAAAVAPRRIPFELRLFRHGKWCTKRPLIVEPGNYTESNQLWERWETIAVMPLGNGMLCWVDRYRGIIFSDVFDEGPNKLRYVPYPKESVAHRRQRFVCTDVRGTLKLVSMAPHGCTHCGCSEHETAFNIWTLKTDDMAWDLETDTNKVDLRVQKLISLRSMEQCSAYSARWHRIAFWLPDQNRSGFE